MPPSSSIMSTTNNETIMTQDPLLAFPLQGGQAQQKSIEEMQEESQRLGQQLEAMQRMRAQAQAPQQQAPVWDEIDGIMRSMSEQEIRFMAGNEEYKESEAAIQAILQREYLRIMRPVVENTKDGKDALEKHLTLVKRLQKSAKDEAGKRYALMDEYMSGYRQMTFDEFLKMKGLQQ